MRWVEDSIRVILGGNLQDYGISRRLAKKRINKNYKSGSEAAERKSKHGVNPSESVRVDNLKLLSWPHTTLSSFTSLSFSDCTTFFFYHDADWIVLLLHGHCHSLLYVCWSNDLC